MSKDGWTVEQVRFNDLNLSSDEGTTLSAFDSLSIMLYSFPAEQTLGGSSNQWNTSLSETDKEFMGRSYPVEGCMLDGSNTNRMRSPPTVKNDSLKLPINSKNI